MKQNNLNLHYCIASKLHYEQLVKDGCYPFNQFTGFVFNFKFYYLDNDFNIIGTKDDIPKMGKFEYPEEPMHYNKEKECWVFGNLESKEECETTNGYKPRIHEIIQNPVMDMKGNIVDYPKPKQVIERITRVEVIGTEGREFSKLLQNSHYEISIQDDGHTIKLFEKANQVKDK